MWHYLCLTAGTKRKKSCAGGVGWGDKILVCLAFAQQKQKENLPDFCPRSDTCVTVVWRKQSLKWVTMGWTSSQKTPCLQYFLPLKPRIYIYAVLRVFVFLVLFLKAGFFSTAGISQANSTQCKKLFFHWQTDLCAFEVPFQCTCFASTLHYSHHSPPNPLQIIHLSSSPLTTIPQGITKQQPQPGNLFQNTATDL